MPAQAGDCCEICQRELEDGSELIRLGCTHQFHNVCVNAHLEVNRMDFVDFPCPARKTTGRQVLSMKAAALQRQQDVSDASAILRRRTAVLRIPFPQGGGA